MNFALIMFVLLVVTGAIWLLDHFLLRKHRAPDAPEPWWIEYPKSFFPVILIVFLLRSFLVEPFKIPSGSMLPTLLIGDFILVNKFTYGVRIPIANVKVMDMNQPQRGEVMVFRYPENPSLDYIKRVVGVPGDKVSYQNKRLAINGEEVKLEPDGQYSYIETGLNFISAQRFLRKARRASAYGAHASRRARESGSPT
jgi:signal peptidase I